MLNMAKATYFVIASAVMATIAGCATLADAEAEAEAEVLRGGGPRTICISVGEVKSVSVVSELNDPPTDYATDFPSKMFDGNTPVAPNPTPAGPTSAPVATAAPSVSVETSGANEPTNEPTPIQPPAEHLGPGRPEPQPQADGQAVDTRTPFKPGV